MHVLLVGAQFEENLPIRYLAAALEAAGHRTTLTGFGTANDAAKVIDRVMRETPEVVGLSMAFQRRAREFGELASGLRRAGYGGHITCGGHFPTFAYRETLERYDAIDTVVRHEGEHTLVELVGAISHGAGADQLGEVAGLAYRQPNGEIVATQTRPLIEDVDSIEFPEREGPRYVHLGIPTAFVVGSRGCYGHCTFCCINAYIRDAGGSRYRARSADNLADEIARLRRDRGARVIVFHDDDFFTRDHARDLERVTALRDALQRRQIDDIALVVKARPDDLDENVFAVLKEIGLLRVYVGIEGGSTQGLRTLGRGVDVAQNQWALDFLRRLDVYACFNMLIFDPDTTGDSLAASLQFLQANPDVPMNFCRTEIYPGTPLQKRLAGEGRLHGDVFGWDYEIAEPVAERAFRLFARTFIDRNFRCDGLMNSNVALGYYLHLLRQFYPWALTPGLRRMAEQTMASVNLDSVQRMQQILRFAASPRAEDPSRFREYCELAGREIAESNQKLEARVQRATAGLTEALSVRRQRPRSSRLATLAAATLALSPLACDPVPPPHTRSVERRASDQDRDAGSRFAQPPPEPTGTIATPPTTRDASTTPPPTDPLPQPYIKH